MFPYNGYQNMQIPINSSLSNIQNSSVQPTLQTGSQLPLHVIQQTQQLTGISQTQPQTTQNINRNTSGVIIIKDNEKELEELFGKLTDDDIIQQSSQKK